MKLNHKSEAPLNNILRLLVAVLIGVVVVAFVLVAFDAYVSSEIKASGFNLDVAKRLHGEAETLWLSSPALIIVISILCLHLVFSKSHPFRLPRWLFEPGPPPPILCKCGYDLSGHSIGQRCPECNKIVTRGTPQMKLIKDLGKK